MNAKRLNWIMTGMYYLFGITASGYTPPVPLSRLGLYQVAGILSTWLNEGVVCGFIPATPGGSAANSVVDSDFTANYPAATAALFLSAVAGLQAITGTYGSYYSAIAAIKP
jgi:hypothetical protein